MSRQKIFEQAFAAVNGSGVNATWAMDNCPDANGCEVHSNGFNTTGGTDGDAGNVVMTDSSDTNGYTPKATFAPDQYSSVVIKTTSFNYSPGAQVRGDSGSGNSYGVDPITFGGGAELLRFDGGSLTLLGSGGATVPGVNTRIELEAEGTTIRALYDGTSETTVTDATYSSGQPGIYCYESDNSAIGDDLECGNLFTRARGRRTGTMPRECYEVPVLEHVPVDRN